MNKYRCEMSFISSKKQRHHYGKIISERDYQGLVVDDKKHYSLIPQKKNGLDDFFDAIVDDGNLETKLDKTPFDEGLYPDGRDFEIPKGNLEN